MDPTLVPGIRFESQFQICVYEHAILRIYISFFFQHGRLEKIGESQFRKTHFLFISQDLWKWRLRR